MNKTQTFQQVTLTPNAVKHLKYVLASNPTDVALRLQVDAGGCSGFQYAFSLTAEIKPDDLVFEIDGVKLIVDTISYEFVKGSQVDYEEELIGAAFVIKNPGASSSCGCGNSFSI